MGVFELAVTTEDDKSIIMKKARKYNTQVATYNIAIHDAELFGKDKRVEQDNMIKFTLDPINHWDANTGKEVPLPYTEFAVMLEMAGLLPSMYYVQPDYTLSAVGGRIYNGKTALYINPVFSASYGSSSQSPDVYLAKNGAMAGKEILPPSVKISFPPRGIVHIDANNNIHQRKPKLYGACDDCLSYDHKKFDKVCAYAYFCRCCLCYLPDEENAGYKHACTAGVDTSGAFHYDPKGKGKGKGKKGKGKAGKQTAAATDDQKQAMIAAQAAMDARMLKKAQRRTRGKPTRKLHEV